MGVESPAKMRTVLVTGGTTRLGLFIAARLRADGWRVLTSSHRADAGADFTADLADPAEPARLFAAVKARLGGNPPDALVNNASLYRGAAEAVERIGFEAPKALTELMAVRTAGRGAVVNVLDTRVLGAGSPLEDPPGYVRAKRRLLAFTRTSAARHGGTLTVNGVAPGPVLAPVGIHEPAGELVSARPTPGDVAAAVSFLLGTPSVTGVVLPVDGGQHLL